MGSWDDKVYEVQVGCQAEIMTFWGNGDDWGLICKFQFVVHRVQV